MNALFRMQSEADDGAAVDHFIREWMKQVRELAYDAEDCVGLYWLRISERHARYGVNRDALQRHRLFPSYQSYSLTAAPVAVHAHRHDSHQLVGINGQADILVEVLIKQQLVGEQHTKVLSIVGFGGVGKTTLGREVCRLLETEFPYQAVVSVSQAFDPTRRDLMQLLKSVLRQVVEVKAKNEILLTGEGKETLRSKADKQPNHDDAGKVKKFLDRIDEWEYDKLVKNLRTYLTDKRSKTFYYVRKVGSPSARNSSTDRWFCSLRVLMCTVEDSKKLFLSRTFVNKECPEELEDVMENILKRCGGLPLAIVSIASVLAGYTSPGSKDKWESIYKSIGSHMESNPTLEGRQILALSYNHLRHELKGCMMYFSIFPEDYEVNKDRLLWRWIAEGLVTEKRGSSLMEVAGSYLDDLVNRNMIQLRDEFKYYWKAKMYRVHDMFLELIVSKSLESNFASLLGGQYATMPYDRIRRLSIQGDDARLEEAEQPRKNMAGVDDGILDLEHVRSLSMFQHTGKKLLDQLGKFRLLRVLDLEGFKGALTKDHMGYICRLYLLRFLSLNGTEVEEIPSEIGKLEHLQTLDVRETSVRGLPDTVTKLYKLERQQISYNGDANLMWKLPLELKKMKMLREVGFAVLGNHLQVAQDVGELDHLQEMVVYVDDITFDNEVLTTFTGSLSKLYSLRRLIIGDVGYGNTLNFLNRLSSPPPLLQYLMIAGGIDRLPSWIMSLTCLGQFNMSWGKVAGDQLFDVLCELPSLTTVCIHNYCYEGEVLVARTRHRFPELITLRVASGSNLPNVIRFENGTMPKLEYLLVNFTDNNEKKIIGIRHLTSLKEVQLWGNESNLALRRALKHLKNCSEIRQVG
ncbi:disease resistance protein Pik-2-like [Oryza glaberrima]|uniref:disease resistance protein Pik-2-like n=1 Tax=Oryza glaberrima TaxID=4538 RepID=UPI00224C1292|nr:disease resistance protein Pik-2-like [Oryza glaberrima]